MPRLVSRSEIDGWAKQLTDAVNAAGRKQRLTLGAVIRSHGGTWDAPAGSLPAAVWSPEAWAAAVNTEVAPVAQKVAAEVFASARRRLPASVTWGASVPTERLADMVTARALAAGPGIARRVSIASLTAAMTAEQVAEAVANAPERYGGITHPEARQTTADAYASAIDQLNTLIDRVAGQMGNAAQSVLAETVDRNQVDPVMNTWFSAMTPTTREEHAAADGQQQRPGDPFDIGGEELLYPGDPTGSDENTINCLCWIDSSGGAFDDVTGTDDLTSDSESMALDRMVEASDTANAYVVENGDTQANFDFVDGAEGSYNAERAAVHKEILDEFMARAENVPKDGESLMLGGLPGAGKSSSLSTDALRATGVDPDRFAVVNPDDFKQALIDRGLVPSVEGLKMGETSPVIHEESSDLATKYADRLMNQNTNVLYDITMGSQRSVEDRLALLEAAGYSRPTMVFVDVEPKIALERAAARFASTMDSPSGGRSVSEDFIRKAQAGDSFPNLGVFEAVRDRAGHWLLFDNSGSTIRLVAQS